MSYATTDPEQVTLPRLAESLTAMTADDLKWYVGALPGRTPTRKANLVDALCTYLLDPAQLRRFWADLTAEQREAVADVVHHHGGRYEADVIGAKYPGVAAPRTARSAYGYSYHRQPPMTFDLLFCHLYDVGTFIAPDVAALLRKMAPAPAPLTLPGRDEPPLELAGAGQEWRDEPPETFVTETERVAIHDLTATLHLVHEGKAAIGATTRLPSLGTLKQLRERLLLGDYFGADYTYDRAEDAIRPFALLMLAQAAKWAAPDGAKGTRLALTKSGQALLAGGVTARHVRQAWQGWVKTGLLDELSRVRAIKGQGSKSVRLTKPAERRESLATALRAAPPGRWVALDDFFRYVRAERLSPAIERNQYSGLYVGWSFEYGSLQYTGGDYWDVVVGTYLRAVLWEFAATLGLIDVAYTLPEESPRDFGDLYGMDDEPYLSRYDGLLGFRLTPLGAYALGLTDEYTPPPAPAAGEPVLALLPNLDVVVTDARRLLPNDRIFLERIGAPQSQDVYRLSRTHLLDLAENGLGLDAVQDFLARTTGRPVEGFPQPVRVFFADVAQRLGALRETGRMVLIESDDPYLAIELSHDATLRATVRLATIDDRPVLLVPEAQEAAVRRQLKKLGYVARR